MDFTILMKHQFLSFGFAQVKPHGVLGTAEGEKDLAPMAPVEVPSTNCHSNSGSMGVLQWLWDFHVVINYHYILSFITIINYYYYLSFEGSIAEKIAIVSSVSRLLWWTDPAGFIFIGYRNNIRGASGAQLGQFETAPEMENTGRSWGDH